MATAHGQPGTALSRELLSHGERFDFFQALRLLTLLAESRDIRVRPELSLGFPASDIASIVERHDGKGFLLTATFLGLYGVSSPLPAFYTEDLFQDAREESTGVRDFLDVLHQRLFELLFAGWKKNRLFLQWSEKKSRTALDMLHAISGLSAAGLESASENPVSPWLRYTGLLGCRPRSALGLQTVLTDYLGDIPVAIVSFVPRRVKIPRDQQFQLGTGQNILGENSFIGEEFMDCQGKFRVRLGPLNGRRFRSLLQEGEDHKPLVELINQYLTDPLDYDLELILDGSETEPARLGASQWSRLGLDMVLFAGESQSELSVIFPPAA